jgi:hypothetical protein
LNEPRILRAGFHCVTLGPWLAKLLREQYGATADHFDFAVDRRIYSPRNTALRERLAAQAERRTRAMNWSHSARQVE